MQGTTAGDTSIGLDKSGYQVNIFLISPRKHMLWYSLEASHQGTSNEYPQHMFSWSNKKNINTFGLKKSALTRTMHQSKLILFFMMLVINFKKDPLNISKLTSLI